MIFSPSVDILEGHCSSFTFDEVQYNPLSERN